MAGEPELEPAGGDQRRDVAVSEAGRVAIKQSGKLIDGQIPFLAQVQNRGLHVVRTRSFTVGDDKCRLRHLDI